MYGLIHKMKKEKNGKQYSKAITTKKQKISILDFGFALYSCFLLRNVLVVIHRNQLLSSGVWFWPFPYVEINNNNSGKKKKKRHLAFSKMLCSFCHVNFPLGYARSSYSCTVISPFFFCSSLVMDHVA